MRKRDVSVLVAVIAMKITMTIISDSSVNIMLE